MTSLARKDAEAEADSSAGRWGMARSVGLGFVLWAVTFAVAGALYPFSVENPRFFQSIIALVLVTASVCVATAYLRGLEGRLLWRAVATALLWPTMGVFLDFLVHSLRPPRFSLREYVETIGLLYLAIPVALLGVTYQRIRSERPR